ncbi:unnamed protein product, partial [Discosporangium mesarthrocarpum]
MKLTHVRRFDEYLHDLSFFISKVRERERGLCFVLCVFRAGPWLFTHRLEAHRACCCCDVVVRNRDCTNKGFTLGKAGAFAGLENNRRETAVFHGSAHGSQSSIATS